MVSNQSAASVTVVYLYTELEMAECGQLSPNLKHWNTPAHCTATEGPNQHPARIDSDIYKLSHTHIYTEKGIGVQYF